MLVDFWDLAEILLRLDSSEAGKRVARHYFTDSVRDRELMLRTIRAGGDLAPAHLPGPADQLGMPTRGAVRQLRPA